MAPRKEKFTSSYRWRFFDPLLSAVASVAGNDASRFRQPATEVGAGEPASGLRATAGSASGLPACRVDQDLLLLVRFGLFMAEDPFLWIGALDARVAWRDPSARGNISFASYRLTLINLKRNFVVGVHEGKHHVSFFLSLPARLRTHYMAQAISRVAPLFGKNPKLHLLG